VGGEGKGEKRRKRAEMEKEGVQGEDVEMVPVRRERPGWCTRAYRSRQRTALGMAGRI
jgi:hypothetical protein